MMAGCATSTPKPVCGPEWQPLAIDRAPEYAIAIDRKEHTTIERVEIAGVDRRLAAELERELQTKPGETVLDAPIGNDLRRLWKLGVIAAAHVELDGGTVRFVLQPRPTIRSVVRSGGDALAQARFRQLEATTFEPARVRRMTDAIRESYVQEGRLDARVEAKQRAHASGVDVCVALDPGPKITIAKLEFRGRRAFSHEALVAALPNRTSKVNRVGGLYDEAAMEYAEWYLLAEYWERGYAEVHIGDPIITRRGKQLEVAIPITEGPVYRIGHVATNLPEGWRFSDFVKPGDVFTRSKIMDARGKLEESLRPYRAYVLPLTKLDKDARTIDITFEVQWRWAWDSVRYWLSRSR